jgi:Spy/CpxP family protein refolding chaperone
MNRRSLVALPGIAALAASRIFAETQETGSSDGIVSHVSTKTMVKHSGSKSAYKVPKSAGKQTRYLNSLTALLSLTSAQQASVAALFTSAGSTRASLHSSLKAARKALKDAVKSNDSGAMTQASSTLGILTGQKIANGAAANAALFQLLTPAQRTKLSQFQG